MSDDLSDAAGIKRKGTLTWWQFEVMFKSMSGADLTHSIGGSMKQPESQSRLDEYEYYAAIARQRGDTYALSVAIDDIRKLRAAVSERRDSERLDYLAKTLHIDATGDQPVYALFIPGTEGVKSKADLRGLIDESIALSERDCT